MEQWDTSDGECRTLARPSYRLTGSTIPAPWFGKVIEDGSG
jgi:hypothetical protein